MIILVATIPWFLGLIIGIVALLVGFVVGFIVTRKIFISQMEKNPPVTREMVRAMYMQMGRKPSESDINKVMATMNIKPKK